MVQSTVHALGHGKVIPEQDLAADPAFAAHPISFDKYRSDTLRPSPANAADESIAAFASRFIVLQVVGLGCVAALWVAGVLDKPFQSSAAPMCWIILAIGALGLICVFLQRWRDVQWIATHVVRIGLLGTVVGLIVAFSAATTGGSANPEDIKPMIATVVSGMYVSLYATLMGIGTNLWLKINLRLLGNQHG